MMLARMLRRGDVSLDYRFHARHYTSGDFLAYYSLPGGRDIFLMSDSAGHDLRASVHSSYFQGLNGLLTGGRTLDLRNSLDQVLQTPAAFAGSFPYFDADLRAARMFDSVGLNLPVWLWRVVTARVSAIAHLEH